MVIEFYGLPGTGKSTTARRLEEKSNFKRVRIKNNIELLWYNFLFFIKYPIKFFILLYYVFTNSNNFKMFYYKFMNTFLHHNAKYQKAKKFKNSIIDQGHTQNIISVFEEKKGLSAIEKYFTFIPKTNKLIIFDADFSVRKNRIEKRNHAPRSEYDDQYLKKWHEITKYNNKLFQKLIKDLDVSYKTIDANKDADEIYKEVLNYIK